tara:strand:- start:11701 stop:11847 length:147 start_codon:yes stop_codon:yes gene_type:complete
MNNLEDIELKEEKDEIKAVVVKTKSIKDEIISWWPAGIVVGIFILCLI